MHVGLTAALHRCILAEGLRISAPYPGRVFCIGARSLQCKPCNTVVVISRHEVEFSSRHVKVCSSCNTGSITSAHDEGGGGHPFASARGILICTAKAGHHAGPTRTLRDADV